MFTLCSLVVGFSNALFLYFGFQFQVGEEGLELL